MKRAAMVVLLLVAAAPQAQAQRRWGVEIGHSYSSAKALHQPATFALNVADSITTDIQGGVLVGGPIGTSASLEFGLRALAGSRRGARPSASTGPLCAATRCSASGWAH